MSSAEDITDREKNSSGRFWRLVLTTPVWEQAARCAISGQFGKATLNWINVSDAHELICKNLELTTAPPNWNEFHPAESWMVVATVSENRSVSDALSQFQPNGSQTVAILLIDTDLKGAWSAWIRRGKATHEVDELRIVGERLPVVKRSSQSKMDSMFRQESASQTDESLLRWSRQQGALGKQVQDRIHASTITLIGTGGIGSLSAMQFGMIGTGRIRLLDPDELKIENLDRTFGVTPGEVGGSKVSCVADYLNMIRPNLPITFMEGSAAESRCKDLLLERTDLLLTCVDDDACRLAVAEIANRTATVHMDIATSVQRNLNQQADMTSEPELDARDLNLGEENELSIVGDIRLMLPGQGCLACVGGIQNIELQRERLRDRPAGSLPQVIPQPWNVQRAGSLISINSVAVGVALQLWFDLMGGKIRNSVWHRLDWHAPELQSESTPSLGMNDCEVCQV